MYVVVNHPRHFGISADKTRYLIVSLGRFCKASAEYRQYSPKIKKNDEMKLEKERFNYVKTSVCFKNCINSLSEASLNWSFLKTTLSVVRNILKLIKYMYSVLRSTVGSS